MSYCILTEIYTPGSIESNILSESFKSKNAAIKHLESMVGEIKPFEHGWNNDLGQWFMANTRRKGSKKYYCIFERA